MSDAASDPVTYIRAWKPYRGGGMPTGIDDPEATEFKVSYKGMPFSCSTIDFKTRGEAEDTARALVACHAHGKREAMRDLRQFIGVPP